MQFTSLARLAASHALYAAGCAAAHVTDAVQDDWPRAPQWLLIAGYGAYSWLMVRSYTLDTEGRVWKVTETTLECV